MNDDMTAGQMLRNAAAQETLQVPGAPFALAARLVERMGFPAVYLSGGAFSAGVLALPDVGLFTLSELVDQTQKIARSIEVPLIVDADTGFGEPINVARTVAELEAAGAAAIQLEDQLLPKRCGHLSGKSLVDTETMCAKLRAAASAKADDSTIILARTDARGVEGLEEAIVRAKRYVEAGADWIFPEALDSEMEFQRFSKEVDVPLVANMTEFGKSPLLTLDQLSHLGYAAVLYPVTMLRIAMRAMQAALAVIEMEGSQESLLDLMQTREELYDLLDYEDFEQRDREYFGLGFGLASESENP
jgi:methylisocitrate lyase